MHHRIAVPDGLIRLSRVQSGVVSREQVLGFGLTDRVIRRLVRQGYWGRLDTGIFLAPDAPPTWLTQVWGGVLLGGDRSRAAGLTAAALHGLADEQSLPIEILVPLGRTPARRDWVQFRQERDAVRAVSSRAEPPRTRIEDTVLDLCAAGTELDCVSWLTRAVQRRLTTVESLHSALDRRSRITHRRLLHRTLADVASGVHSVLEYDYKHQVERAHGLPDGRRQSPRPGRNGFLDVYYEGFGLVVELDGRLGHVEEGEWRDHLRDNAHTVRGLRSLRYGRAEVTAQPCAIAVQVAGMLSALGWAGYPTHCPRCC